MWFRDRHDEIREELRAAAREAIRASDLAASAAAEARRAVAQVEALAGPSPGDDTASSERWRFFRICAFILACLALTLIPVRYIGPAFQSRDPEHFRNGSVALLYEPDPKAQAADVAERPQPVISARLTFGDYVETQYWLYFPKSYLGRTFALVLSGAAVMDSVTLEQHRAGVESTFQRLDAPIWTCSDSIAIGTTFWSKGEHASKCQMIVGTIGYRAGWQAAPECFPADHGSYVWVLIQGYSPKLSVPVDWAHDNLTTEDVASRRDVGVADVPVDTWNGHALGVSMVGASPQVCQHVDTSAFWQDYVPQVEPTATDRRSLTWTNPGTSFGVVATKRDASTTGNLLLLVIGAGFGLTFGFIPVAYDARRSWKRAKRRERSTG